MLHIDGRWFKDEQGRTLLLRGVNLGGSSKVPATPDGATYRRSEFFDHRAVSFVGRPFPLAEAGEHFARLRAWGFTFLRFLVTWEAIEHAGPGRYDYAYLDYLYAIVEKAGEYDITVLIDPHQDVWSRFSGGDGAPGWTFEAIGMDISQFASTGAALVHSTQGDPFPKMIWPTNHARLAAATMFTLFFAGNTFAPATTIAGEPAQDFLQRHYLAAIQQVARRLSELKNVIGYDTLNEPGSGYIGHNDLRGVEAILRIGEIPTPFQSMVLGAGIPQSIDVWKWSLLRPRPVARRLVNHERASVWAAGHSCIWRQNGVWGLAADGTPQLLRPDHFRQVNGRAADFGRDFLRPFANRFAQAIRAADPRALIFVETEVGHDAPRWGPGDAPNVVYAPHWYDVLVLFTKRFSPLAGLDLLARKLVFGRRAIRAAFARQIASYQRQARERMGDVPTLIGEFGIPFDLRGKRAYRDGDFTAQIGALDRSFRALEDTLASGTLWNYTADNNNVRGDMWNDEDLSIFSRDQRHNPASIHSGGRALAAAVRPYARRTAGEPLRMAFDYRSRAFEYVFRHDPAVTAPTEIFMPNYQYPSGYTVAVSDGACEIDRSRQALIYRHSERMTVHTIRCSISKRS